MINYKAILAIYFHEIERTKRTVFQSIVSPIISTSLYFIIFGAAIGSRIREIDGISYSWYTDTKRLINKEHEYVGIWRGEYIEFASHQRKTDHLYHPDYKRQTLIVGY